MDRLRSRLLAATVALLLGGTPAAGATEAGYAPHLTEEHAIRLMRTALLYRYPVSWKLARGHELSCPIAFLAERGGATQKEEIRRRCSFSWSAEGRSYSGDGIIWLSGAPNRVWHLQATVTVKHAGKVEVEHLGGPVHPV